MTICALIVCQTKKNTLAIEGGMRHAHMEGQGLFSLSTELGGGGGGGGEVTCTSFQFLMVTSIICFWSCVPFSMVARVLFHGDKSPKNLPIIKFDLMKKRPLGKFQKVLVTNVKI